MRDRRSGILLHPTSLPGEGGVGELGGEAHRFLEWLVRARQRLWQVLPLGPTGYGDSPYQALSARAGNPTLVSLELLHEEGLLLRSELPEGSGACGRADLAGGLALKRERLALAFRRFESGGKDADFADFRAREASWLPDWTLFRALKDVHHEESWTKWPEPIARRDEEALAAVRRSLERAMTEEAFVQFCFERQWSALRASANAKDIVILGDLPLYPAHDSVEVWTRPDLFHLDSRGNPTSVAGVPPDYFSATGQRWGNPLYNWPASEREGHRTFVDRVRGVLARVDRIRLDHFRGLEAYWEIPAEAKDARSGRWVPGAGASVLETLRRALGGLPFVAENLGVVTPEVEGLRKSFGLPGMAILTFAFGKDPQAPSFRPDAYSPDTVAYTGTHDNDTAIGWWEGGAGASVRTASDVEEEKAFALSYLAADGHEMNWTLIGALEASLADTVVIPMQDVLGLGSWARMNTPATAAGNWIWRLGRDELNDATAVRLAALAAAHGRCERERPS